MQMFETHEDDGFRFVDEGPARAQTVLFLHGMLGSVDNWTTTINDLTQAGYRCLAPRLPIYDLPAAETNVAGLTSYVARFIDSRRLNDPVIVGNSLGGHVALEYALTTRRQLRGLVLTGASGIQEVLLGKTRLRRFDREYVRDRAALTFHDPVHVTEDLLDEVMQLVHDRPRALNLIRMGRSAKSDTVTDRLQDITIPSLLIWGKNDQLTPPKIAMDFVSRLQDARVEFIDDCGHVPMVEHPQTFSRILLAYLEALTMP